MKTVWWWIAYLIADTTETAIERKAIQRENRNPTENHHVSNRPLLFQTRIGLVDITALCLYYYKLFELCYSNTLI